MKKLLFEGNISAFNCCVIGVFYTGFNENMPVRSDSALYLQSTAGSQLGGRTIKRLLHSSASTPEHLHTDTKQVRCA